MRKSLVLYSILFACLMLLQAGLIVGCSPEPKPIGEAELLSTNSAGRVFVRVSDHGDPPPGVLGPASLWQPVDARGPEHPVFIRRLRTPGMTIPDEFTRAL